MKSPVNQAHQIYVELGNQLSKEGKLSEAIQQYQLALELEPNLVPAHVKLADAYESQQKFNQSIIHREKVVKLRPNNATRLAQRARVKQYLGKISEAIADYERSLHLNTQKPIWIYQELGQLLQQTHQFEKAVTIYQQAVEIEGTANLYY